MENEPDPADMTTALKRLSIPVDTVDDAFEESAGTALFLCRDSDAKKWGPRWLSQSNMQVTVASDPANGLEIVRSMSPEIIVVEASLTDASGAALFTVLQDAADIGAFIIVLCGNARETKAALDTEVFDVARKPFDWQAIARRAGNALQLKSTKSAFDEANQALQEALDLANVARQRLRSQERFEPVTGLPNKVKFVDLLRRAMRGSDRDGSTLAVFVVGFTRFRLVIEAMGQEQADRVLTEIGRKLVGCLKSASVAADPDQPGLRTAAIGVLDQFRFGLLMTVREGSDSIQSFQSHLLETLSRPIEIQGQVVHLSACLGVAMYPQDADGVDKLLQRADNAMRDAQSRGGGFKFHCAATDLAAARKLRLENMLHESLERRELSLAYQPIIDVKSGQLRSVEALLRWRQPDNSLIPPDEFVVIAEESGLMIRMGEYALELACRQLAAWRNEGLSIPYICVNVAKAQLMSSTFGSVVHRILRDQGLDASDLELEISERGVLSGDEDVVSQLRGLKSLGVRLSIDDFGTGDSAIAYLKELPVDVLKIDRSYVAGIAVEGKDVAIASAMIALGQRLQLIVVAEGVETEEQLQILREFGCDCYQGFYAAKPLDPQGFAEFVSKNAT